MIDIFTRPGLNLSDNTELSIDDGNGNDNATNEEFDWSSEEK